MFLWYMWVFFFNSFCSKRADSVFDSSYYTDKNYLQELVNARCDFPVRKHPYLEHPGELTLSLFVIRPGRKTSHVRRGRQCQRHTHQQVRPFPHTKADAGVCFASVCWSCMEQQPPYRVESRMRSSDVSAVSSASSHV